MASTFLNINDIQIVACTSLRTARIGERGEGREDVSPMWRFVSDLG